VPKVQLKQPKVANYEHQRDLALAAVALLYGKGPYEQSFDRFVAALAAHTGGPAHWEIATALSAIVYPKEHMCVQPTLIRKQLKSICSPGAAPAAKPSGAEYNRVLAVARVVTKKLGEQGEVPRDLLDVLDFMCLSLQPGTKVRPVSAKQKAGGAEKGQPEVEAKRAGQE